MEPGWPCSRRGGSAPGSPAARPPRSALFSRRSIGRFAGVELVAELAADEEIECDLERRAAYTYAATGGERSTIESEHDAAREAGLNVHLVEETDLPYPTHEAVRLDRQIQFHPVRYVQGLAGAVDGEGSAVFENSRALRVETG